MPSQARDGRNTDAAIHSTFANDPDMRELIELFVSELPGRIDEIRVAASSQDAESLRRLMHMLRGSCGGYGFAELGRLAGRIEEALGCCAIQTPDGEGALDNVRAEVHSLIALCARVTAAAPD